MAPGAELTEPKQMSWSPEQRGLIESDGSVYVEACPGAGKTQSIVQRFIERPAATEERRGVGLLSFTNAAVNEVRRRCAGAPELLASPNFVGTLDAFINRFIVSPAFTSDTGIAPQFCDVWARLPGTTIEIPSRAPAQLDWFRIDPQGKAALDVKRVPGIRRAEMRRLAPGVQRALERKAGELWLRKTRAGILDADSARMLMKKYLADSVLGGDLRRLLAARFYEIIVDEVQDCVEDDTLLLETIQGIGIRLVLVGDPDQAIYGFRGASGSDLVKLRSQMSEGDRLSGNFRSSPAVCKAVSSLRSSEHSDAPVGSNSNDETPVHVMVFSDLDQIKPRVQALLARHSIKEDQSVVLAYQNAVSRRGAGAGAQPSIRSTARALRLALAIQTLQQSDIEAKARTEALYSVQAILREITSATSQEAMREDTYLAERQLTKRAFQEVCLRLALTVVAPFDVAPSEFLRNIRGQSQLIGVLGGLNPGSLRSPNGDTWPALPGSAENSLPYSSVHGFKGLERQAVVLVIPHKGNHEADAVDDWESGTASEQRRVLYVGASRAERLLILAVHDSRAQLVTDMLTRDKVPHCAQSDTAARS